MNQGDVMLAQFPFTDASSSKVRPILIVSANPFNSGEDVIAVPISSRPDQSDAYSIHVGSGKFRGAGLRMESSIKWAKPATISKLVVVRKLGKLQTELLSETLNKILTMFDKT